MADDVPLPIDVDDYEGTRVQCDADRWVRKIDENHPELSGRQAEVAQTVAQPEIVLQDRDYPERRHLIRRAEGALYIVVIVEYRHTKDGITGRMVTAFLRSRLRSDDLVLFVNARR